MRKGPATRSILKENIEENFDHRKQQQPAWKKTLSYVQTNKDDVSAATATTKGTEVITLQEQINEMNERINDNHKQGIEKKRKMKIENW